MTHQDRYHNLAAGLGLSGGWLTVSHKALLDRTMRIAPGCYFLVWGDRHRGLLWEEGQQGPDSRIPPMAYWMYGILFADHRPSKEVEHLIDAGEYPYPTSGLSVAFRGNQEFAHREALLRQVGFHQWTGPYGFLECIATPVEWEWK